MGRLVDAGALLKAIGNHGSDMIVPNVYLATGKSTSIDLARYFIDGESLNYSCTVDENIATIKCRQDNIDCKMALQTVVRL